MSNCRCSLCTSRYGNFLNKDDRGFWALCRKCETMVKQFLMDLKTRRWYTHDMKNWIDQSFNYGNTAFQIIMWCIDHDKWLPETQTEKELRIYVK